MKKVSKFSLGLLGVIMGAATLLGCSGCGDPHIEQKEEAFDFSVPGLVSGRTDIELGVQEQVEVIPTGVLRNDAGEIVEPVFSYTATPSAIVEVDDFGYVTASGVTANLSITVTEETSQIRRKLSGLKVTDSAPLATGGFNYASASGEDAIGKRTRILGSLEKYAMDSHLTGITLFENGGYVKYNPRIELPTKNYITGYGFGILSEGDITSDLEKETVTEWKRYYHSAQSQDPANINAWNATGSAVSDLNGYITSSFFGTKMTKTKDGYEWYPVLAKDKVQGQDYKRPTPVDNNGVAKGESGFVQNPTGLYESWRIYVKTGADGLKYRTASESKKSFNNREVALEDYLTTFKLLLTQSTQQYRGAELAGDTSYGIKGAQAYFNRTSSALDNETIDNNWNTAISNGDIGLKIGTDDIGGSYIQFSILNPIDDFTAMYTFSSNLYSPIPESFIKDIGGNGAQSFTEGAKKYGQFNNGSIIDYTLCLGAYYLEDWQQDSVVVFKRDDGWFERVANKNRYKIEGIKIRTIDTSQDTEAVWKQFEDGALDAAGVPQKQISEQIGKPGVYQTKGDSTFKLNINACTQERFDELFGKNGTIATDSQWKVKPWMSNDNFLKGLFFSINRKEFAQNRGVQPSINYFADAYLSDPENGVSYNSTEAHKNAVMAYQTSTVEDGAVVDAYGYSKTKAIKYFKSAVDQLLKSGDIKKGKDPDHPYEMEIHIKWMYQTDVADYGEDIKSYFESAFNDPQVSGGLIKLVVSQDAVTNWEDVYNLYMMKGKFDLGFGAISGNTYNPLNFLEVLKSDNSSGFTLNWGADTSEVDTKRPIVFDGKKWSFDALWNVADHGGVVENGKIIKPVNFVYMELPTSLDGSAQIQSIYNGAKIAIPYAFANVGDSAKFAVSDVKIYLAGCGSYSLAYEIVDGKIVVTISAAQGAQFNQDVVTINKLVKDDPSAAATNIPYPLVLDWYGTYWSIEVYYTISINNGTPTQNVIEAAKNREEWDAANKSLSLSFAK